MTQKFNILQNPLVLLGVEPTASNQDVIDAFDDALSAGRTSETDLVAARQALLIPKRRLEAELSTLIDAPADESRLIIEQLRRGSHDAELRRLTPRLAPISRLNVVTHVAANTGADAELLVSFVGALADVNVSSIYETLQRARETAGFAGVDVASVREALHALFAQHASSVFTSYEQRDLAAAHTTQCVNEVLCERDDARLAALDVLLRAYRQLVNVELPRIRQDIDKAAADLRDSPSNSAALKFLSTTLNSWLGYWKPLVILDAHKGRDEQEARALFDLVRSLCLELANNSKRSDVALQVSQLSASVFKELPRASATLAEDLRTLETNITAETMQQHLEAGRYSDTLSSIDRLSRNAATEEEKRALQNLRQRIEAKRRDRNVRWGFSAAVGVGVLLVWIASSHGPTSPSYSSPRTTYAPSPYTPPPKPTYPAAPTYPSPPTYPPTWSAPSPHVPPTNDYTELKPVVGRGLVHSRPNIRYCLFQRQRLEAIRSMLVEEFSLTYFNEAVADWNSRCGDYQYRTADMSAVQVELPAKQPVLQAEARRMVDSWKTSTAGPWPGLPPNSPQTQAIVPPPPTPPPQPTFKAPPTSMLGRSPTLPPSDQPELAPDQPSATLDELFERMFGGLWVIDRDACPGSGKKSMAQPVTISALRAQTSTRTCEFVEKSHYGSDWNVQAECRAGQKRWTSIVRLARDGDTLKWTNETATTTYYRCG